MHMHIQTRFISRPSLMRHACVCLSSVTLCIAAKRCVLKQKLLLTAYRKSYMRNLLVPKWMTLTFVLRLYQGHVNHCVTFDVHIASSQYIHANWSLITPIWISWPVGLDWIVQCFTSPPTQYRLYGRRFLQVKRPNQQYQSTEGSYKGKQHKENTKYTCIHTKKVDKYSKQV